ncbi:MAG: transglycosylase SLT domain-containing protein [Novosphingobium sp.]
MHVTITARHRLFASACALAATLQATSAAANSAAVDYFRNRANRTEVPSILSQDERAYYSDLFSAIDKGDWTKVQSLFAQKPDGPLHLEAKAEYFTAPGSPRIELDELNQWLTKGRGLPQAEQIARLALSRGANGVPDLPDAQRLSSLPSMPKRIRPRETGDGTMPGNLASAIQLKIKNDDPAGARALLDGIDWTLSDQARAEWRQKVAWSFYIENDDQSAYALGQLAAQGAGPWVAEGWWTAGLAAWRLGDFTGAEEAFGNAASRAGNPELMTAALYWQSRAAIRNRQPEKAADLLRKAAGRDETLYGMLAIEQLGLKLPETHFEADFTQDDWQKLRDVPAVRAAVGLSQIGQDGRADEVLRYQARTGSAAQYQSLSRLARDLGMPSTQLWMGYNAPYGGQIEPATRFPTPKWVPVGGWQVDPALVYAHALQESMFRASVVSPAGARGLMQIMPATGRQHGAALGYSGNASDLNKPEVNLAFGQRHLIMLRDDASTQGLLPKMMAAYNAGTVPVRRWATEIRDQGDPLLWIESVPYWETRGYVNIVMRNYWMYERQAGGPSESRMALAQGMWPTFPGLGAAKAVRMNANGVILRGR